MASAASRLIVRRHRVGVMIVLGNDRGEVLLLRHVFHTTAEWGIPGGWLEPGETPQQGALRELREETGLEAVLGPVVHLSREPEPSHIPIVFAAHVKPGTLRLGFEIRQARWCGAGDLPETLDPFVRDAIHRGLRWCAELQPGAPPSASG